MVDELAEAFVVGEERTGDEPFSEEEIERLQHERATFTLCDEANIEVFCTWYLLGGREGGLSPMEAAEMPAAMRKDFLSILRRISWARRRMKIDKKFLVQMEKEQQEWRNGAANLIH